MPKTTATLVKKAREHAGLTQQKLAEKIPVNPNTVAGWEQGRHQPTLDCLAQIAAICKVVVTCYPDAPDGEMWSLHPLDSTTEVRTHVLEEVA
jgi:ribosome-binding protein aMBF1 (putative translation factor)